MKTAAALSVIDEKLHSRVIVKPKRKRRGSFDVVQRRTEFNPFSDERIEAAEPVQDVIMQESHAAATPAAAAAAPAAMQMENEKFQQSISAPQNVSNRAQTQ